MHSAIKLIHVGLHLKYWVILPDKFLSEWKRQPTTYHWSLNTIKSVVNTYVQCHCWEGGLKLSRSLDQGVKLWRTGSKDRVQRDSTDGCNLGPKCQPVMLHLAGWVLQTPRTQWRTWPNCLTLEISSIKSLMVITLEV